MKWVIRVIGIVVCVAVFLIAIEVWRFVRIPPRSETITAMGETMARIVIYMEQHADYPKDLSVLPVRRGYANQITDAWGRQLSYSVDERGVITFSSLGRDGKPGGDGLDADIVHCYPTRNEDGSLNLDDVWFRMTEGPPGGDTPPEESSDD